MSEKSINHGIKHQHNEYWERSKMLLQESSDLPTIMVPADAAALAVASSPAYMADKLLHENIALKNRKEMVIASKLG